MPFRAVDLLTLRHRQHIVGSMDGLISPWDALVPRPQTVQPVASNVESASAGHADIDATLLRVPKTLSVGSSDPELARDVTGLLGLVPGVDGILSDDVRSSTVIIECEYPERSNDAPSVEHEQWRIDCGVDSDCIVINASFRTGALRAAAMLAQLLTVAMGQAVTGDRYDFPECREHGRGVDNSSAGRSEETVLLARATVTGAPDLRWRGGMLDCSRHMLSVAFIKRFIDLLALHGMNIFHWHLTDDQGWRLPSRAYPELERRAAWRDDNTTEFGRYGGIYSGDDIASVVEHAARRGVTVVPEIDIPGHVSAILHAYPQFGCRKEPLEVPTRGGIFEDVLCAGSDEVHTFLESVFDELCDLFPGPYIHLGGDECPADRWSECPTCRGRMKRLGIDDPALLHGHLVESAANAIRRRGRTPVGWDEVLEAGAPAGMLIMCWRDMAHARPAIESGYDVVICPTNRACYFDHQHRDDPDEPGRLSVCTIEDTYRFDPRELGIEGEKGDNGRGAVVGSQGNIWTEAISCGKHAEYMAFPRMAALSEVLAGTAGRGASPECDLQRIRSHARRLRLLGVNAYDGPVR